VAAEKKAHLSFYWVASSEGQTEGSVLLVESGVVKSTLAAGEDVAKFVADNAYPLVGQLTPENYQFYMDRGMDMFWFGLAPSDSASVEAIVAGVQSYKDKFSYVWLDYEKFEGFLKQQMGCDAVNCGVLVKNNIKYRMNDNGFNTLTADNVAAFLALEVAGTLKSFTKTQDVPAQREEENVVVLVGKNFEAEVQEHNVFVFFYAPWCGHCKTAKPDYQKLKEQLNRPDIVIAQFDATENDVPHSGIKVEGFPTFYLFKAGQ